jgi:hypothetical protein
MSTETIDVSAVIRPFIEMEAKQYHKIMFIQNALNDGWTIKKQQNSYHLARAFDWCMNCYTCV